MNAIEKTTGAAFIVNRSFGRFTDTQIVWLISVSESGIASVSESRISKPEDCGEIPVEYLTPEMACVPLAELAALREVAKAGNDLAADFESYLDALGGKNTDELHPSWKLEQAAKSLLIFKSAKAASPVKVGNQPGSLSAPAQGGAK